MYAMKHRDEESMVLNTKLYIPQSRSKVVFRKDLLEFLDMGKNRKLSLVCAPAGFGKTTLVSQWVVGCDQAVAWLSLDEGDNDATRFFIYLIAAIQKIIPTVGEGIMFLIKSQMPPQINWILTNLINEIITMQHVFTLVLDDYHVIDAKPVNDGISFLLENLPPQMNLIIISRDIPNLPLAQLRVGNQLTELGAKDLCFTRSEVSEFLSQVMSLNLGDDDITVLETRTEGWIAGLQLAAISLQGHKEPSSFINSFTGSNYFVMDYLVEEVLHQQSESIQRFLLYTSILDRLCGPLCDALLCSGEEGGGGVGAKNLEYLKGANLFLIQLDNERKWYRYHHLFADLLRERLVAKIGSTLRDGEMDIFKLHKRASLWYEENGFEIEAFKHATAANDIKRATRLVEGGGMPLHFRGAVAPVMKWFKSLTKDELDAHPSLWVMHASACLFLGQTAGVEEKLVSAEAALKSFEIDDKIQDLFGHIAAIRATLAVTRHDVNTIITQSNKALKYVEAKNLPIRSTSNWALGYAYLLEKNYVAAGHAYAEALAISEVTGHVIMTIMAKIGFGYIQEVGNHLYKAVEYYQGVLQIEGHQGFPATCDAYLGLARIFYQWNDIERAKEHLQQAMKLAEQIEHTDRIVICEIFLARLKLYENDAKGAANVLEKVNRCVHENNFVQRISEVTDAQVRMLLYKKHLYAATQIASSNHISVSSIRIHLAKGDAVLALNELDVLRKQIEEKNWEDELLNVLVLQSVALYIYGEIDKAVELLEKALGVAELEGFVRIFLDEGATMNELLSEAAMRGIMPDYIKKLKEGFKVDFQRKKGKFYLDSQGTQIEALSQRELEILKLIALGFSNQEISKELFLAVTTVKGYNQKIFAKLHVQRRTEAVSRAQELGLI